MTAHPTRRSLLRAVPVLAVPLAVLPGAALASDAAPLTEVAPADTPVLRLYREVKAMEAAFNTLSDGEEADRLYAKITEAEWKLTREPVTCLADLAAKVLQLTQIRDEQDTIFAPDLLAEMEAMLAGRA